jgi:hypothetical protein
MKRAWILVLAIVLVLGLAGCKSAEDKAVEKLTEGLLSDKDVDVDIDGDEVTIETEDGDITIASDEGKLPDGFPRDFPVYDDMKIGSTSRMGNEETVSYYVEAESRDDFDEVYEWYKAELEDEGWEITTDLLTTDGNSDTVLLVKKGDDSASVTITEVDSGVDVGIIVNVAQ